MEAWTRFHQTRELAEGCFPLGKVDPARLRRKAMQNGGKAMGMDGWAGYELRLLPFSFWVK